VQRHVNRTWHFSSVLSMTRPTEARKHTAAGECVAFAERYPKWNPRYVAYALSQGATDIKAFRDAQPSNVEFIAWVGQRRDEFRAEQNIRGFFSRRQEQAFDAWLERLIQECVGTPPEPIAPIVDRVMADIMARRRGGAEVRT
jgi:hypothetical protein